MIDEPTRVSINFIKFAAISQLGTSRPLQNCDQYRLDHDAIEL